MNNTSSMPGKNRGVLVVVFACLMGIMAGLIYSWSIWVQPICNEYGWQRDQVALMGNIMLATYIIGVLIGGNLMARIGAKNSCFLGSILFGGFFVISSFVSSPALMYITYGVVAGLGTGILYVVGQFAASSWFPKSRGMVMGIFLAIFGLSVTVFSAPINNLLANVGVKRAMFLVGLIVLIVCLVSSVFISTPPLGYGQNTADSKNAPVSEATSLTAREALKTKEFWLIFAAYTCLVWPYTFISSYIGVFATEEKLLTTEQAVLIVSVCGIGSALGRFIGGILVDKLDCKPTYLIMCLCSVISCLGLMFVQGSTAIVIMFFIMTFGYGGRTPVYGVVFGRQFGNKYASGIYGFGSLGTAVMCIIAPLVTARVLTSTGSFRMTFVIAAIIAAIGCASMMLVPKKGVVQRIDEQKAAN